MSFEMLFRFVALMAFLVVVLVVLLSLRSDRPTPVHVIAKELDKACSAGRNEFYISLPQPKPMLLMDGRDLAGVDGDPAYLIYYERFPVGMSIPWDWLRRKIMKPVIFSILPDGVDRDEYMSQLIERGMEIARDDVEVVFINEISKGGGSKEKFATCGEGSICMKVGQEIKSRQLKSCVSRGIDQIFLETPGWRLFKALGVGRRQYEFYLASPCKVKLKAEIGTCKCRAVPVTVFEDGEPIGKDIICDNRGFWGGEEIEVPCLKISGDVNYLSDFCFNFEMADKVTLPWQEMGDLLKKIFLQGSAATLYDILETPPPSIRDKCFRKIDDNSIIFLPRCLDDLPAGGRLKRSEDLKKELGEAMARAILQVLGKFGISEEGDVLYEMWPLNRPVVENG